jgi:hypothetical protein
VLQHRTPTGNQLQRVSRLWIYVPQETARVIRPFHVKQNSKSDPTSLNRNVIVRIQLLVVFPERPGIGSGQAAANRDALLHFDQLTRQNALKRTVNHL